MELIRRLLTYFSVIYKFVCSSVAHHFANLADHLRWEGAHNKRTQWSLVLFNAVLEDQLRKIMPTWVEKGWGINFGCGCKCLQQNLRFADDVLLVRRSSDQVRNMLIDSVKTKRQNVVENWIRQKHLCSATKSDDNQGASASALTVATRAV